MECPLSFRRAPRLNLLPTLLLHSLASGKIGLQALSPRPLLPLGLLNYHIYLSRLVFILLGLP